MSLVLYLRTLLDLNQAQMATLLDVPRRRVSAIEHGHAMKIEELTRLIHWVGDFSFMEVKPHVCIKFDRNI